jgi:hypothetical protein
MWVYKESPCKAGRAFQTFEPGRCPPESPAQAGSDIGFFTDLGGDHVRDVFGVVWYYSIDKDIDNVVGCVLPAPTLQHYAFPDLLDHRFFEEIPARIARYGDRFRVFQIGFSLYKRAWAMRGLQNLLMDFYDHHDFVHGLLRGCQFKHRRWLTFKNQEMIKFLFANNASIKVT